MVVGIVVCTLKNPMPSDPTISQLLKSDKPVLSIEFFPPKEASGVTALKEVAVAIQQAKPDFVSVTYGAGGTTRDRSLEVSRMLRNELGFTVMPHLTCVGATREELQQTVEAFYDQGFRNIMTLRGDPPKGQTLFQTHQGGLSYATDLVKLVKELHPDLCCGVAGYPEKHPEAPDLVSDLQHLAEKVQAGGSFVTTQLFFNNDVYFRFVDQCHKQGITVPILPGIMPVLSLKQIQRFVQLCGSELPPQLLQRLEAAGENAEALELVGIEWAMEQIHELIERGAPGAHLYVLNRSRSALALSKAISKGF